MRVYSCLMALRKDETGIRKGWLPTYRTAPATTNKTKTALPTPATAIPPPARASLVRVRTGSPNGPAPRPSRILLRMWKGAIMLCVIKSVTKDAEPMREKPSVKRVRSGPR